MIPLAFAAGAACSFFLIALVSVTSGAETIQLPRTTVPVWVHTLTSHGAVRPRVRVVESFALAALMREVRDRYVDDVARWVMSSVTDPGFAEWWESTCVNERKREYRGRRRYEEVSLRPEWRARWAEHGTQEWPTLSTSGDAWVLVPTLTVMDEKIPTICTGMTFNETLTIMPVEHVARNLSENPRLLHSV